MGGSRELTWTEERAKLNRRFRLRGIDGASAALWRLTCSESADADETIRRPENVAIFMPTSPPSEPGPMLCTEEEVARLVHDFYARVRQDAQLGPIFDARVHDWPAHLAQLTDFWSAMLRGTRRFRGAPVPKHMAVPGLSAGLFLRWLELFGQTTADCGNPAMRREADAMAQSIADNLWQRYQADRDPFAAPQPLRPVSLLPIVSG